MTTRNVALGLFALALLLGPLACSSEEGESPPPTTVTSTGSGGEPSGGGTADGGSGGGSDGGGGSAPESCPDAPWQTPDPDGYCATYELPVELPDCNPSDSEVAIIASEADWSGINDPTKRIFCVQPGDYLALGRIELTVSGTADAPRIIRYHHPTGDESIHPAAQAEADRAIIGGLRFRNADHWVIHQLTARPRDPGHINVIWLDDGDHNLLDRLLVEGGGGGGGQVQIAHQGNALQNSVLRNTILEPNADVHCLVVAGPASDFRIVNNEIYDCGGDSIQVHAGNVNGLTVIENNDLYLTSALYSDCTGNQQTSGTCACAENALDLKNGGVDGEPLLVEHNRAWGFRDTDTACSGTGSGGNGFIIHIGAQYVLVRANVLLDVPGGIATPNELAHHVSLIGNVVADTVTGGTGIGQLYKADRFDGYYNSLIRTGGLSAGGDHDFDCNLPDAATSANTELCISIKRWTGPESVCIDHGRLELTSLDAACQAQAGQTAAYGIDDRAWTPADASIQ